MKSVPKKSSFIGNMSWIFVGNIAHAVLSFSISIIVARYLTVNDNGVINYAGSWIAFYNAIAGMGINSIINKYTTENIDESSIYLVTAMAFRTLTGIVGVVLVGITVLVINPGDSKTLYVSLIQGLTIVFSIGDTLVYWFRYKRQANAVAIMRLVAFFIPAIIRVLAVVLFKNIYLYAFGLVFESLVFSLLLIYEYRKHYCRSVTVSLEHLRILLRNSYPFVLSAVLATIYAQTDRIMLKNMLDNDSVAYYSIAVTVAGLMSIVSSAVIEGFRPEIMSSKNAGDAPLYEKRLVQAYAVTFWMCIFYGVFVTVFAKSIILLLYGEKYLPSVPALSLIVWYTSFSYFGTINSIYMVAEGKQAWVQLTTLVGALTNVFLNLALIPNFGIVGAAATSLITQFVGNLLVPAIVSDLRPMVCYMFKGVILQGVFPSRGK